MREDTKPHHVDTLKHVALLGGGKEYVALSSKDLGRALRVSQQSASQRILELLQAGLLQRDLAARKQRVRVSAKGVELLRKEYADYHRIFEVHGALAILGVVTSGLGEGAFYMKQRGYREQFRRKLGYEPYEGTLNLRVEGGELAKLQILWDEAGTPIEGFTDGGRTFGGAKVFPAKVDGVECAVILPIRTHHTDNLELISRIHLRSKLGIRDGDAVAVDVRLAAGANVQ
jgi:riboflavin kinase